MKQERRNTYQKSKQKKTQRRGATPYSILLSTTDRIKSAFETVCTPFDLTGQQYNVLRILRGAEPDGLPTLTIAERVIERTPGITRMIDRLEAKGLVGREIRSHDRRCVYCRITKKGLKLLELLDEPVNEFNKSAFAALSDTEIEKLVAVLSKIRDSHEGTPINRSPRK
ncbi:MAG TPA: MarR family transcriptional regulator [Pyrinomonadaceae bacterium]|nr:MarR family transcriptional regulator [Pyrinomonadaceae bacterium]